MNTRRFAALCLLSLSQSVTFAAGPPVPGCGTHGVRTKEELYLHRRAAAAKPRARALAAASANRDYGNVAVIGDGDGVVARRNEFNLNRKSVEFTPAGPAAERYRVQTTSASYDDQLAQAGARLDGLDDDDSREVPLPFIFPFYGEKHRSLNVNSDGNLTFGGGFTLTERSLGMLVGGRPRIAGLFTDLDPSVARDTGGVYVLSEPWRFVVTWKAVPRYSDYGYGAAQTFQIRMYPDGKIEIAFSDVSVYGESVVGISPGSGKGTLSLVSFASGPAGEYSGAVADRFSGLDSVDVAAAAQKFYATHEDAYDYLVFFNAVGVAAGDGAVAFEVTVRNQRTGYGDSPVEAGEEFGSSRRLQAVMNMGPLYQYPEDPNGRVAARGTTGDTGLSVLGHEAGHLFLAFASVRDPEDPEARPMLGRAMAHWAFNFNSEASLLEGNRIQDDGESARPRFRTTQTVEGYSPLDQYLMGFRAPDEVPPTFLVTETSVSAARAPQVGITFNGARRNVLVEDIIAAEGRRTPDHTVAQRRFRFGFVLIVAEGAEPPAEQIAKVEAYRSAFEDYYAKAAANRASADASLRRAIQLSAAPAAGVLAGGTGTATITLNAPASAPVTILLATTTGSAQIPASVMIPAGGSQASFTIRGVREGVEELTARPSDTAYETAVARVQVLASAAGLRLALVTKGPLVSGDPVLVRVTDVNDLPYSGVRVNGAVTHGSLESAGAATNENGIATFRWAAPGGAATLTATIDGAAAPLTVRFAARPAVLANGVVNAASFAPGITPGSLGTVFGAGLSGGLTADAKPPLPYGLVGVQVLINGTPAQLVYVSDTQINFLAPGSLAGPVADVEIENPNGRSVAYRVAVSPLSPGVFVIDSANQGAVLISGTAQTTFMRPARPGDVIEIYATGLGSSGPSAAFPGYQETITRPEVRIGDLPATVLIATPLARFPGLYQINVMIPQGVPSGDQTLAITMDNLRSNETRIRIQ